MLKKKNEGQLGEKRVFHGTWNKNIPAICKQGFDFRLNGQTTGITIQTAPFHKTKTLWEKCKNKLCQQ
jgi:hypothetical protein